MRPFIFLLSVERGNAIAVSVRSFRVAGIKGLVAHDQDEAVTIQTAVQVPSMLLYMA